LLLSACFSESPTAEPMDVSPISFGGLGGGAGTNTVTLMGQDAGTGTDGAAEDASQDVGGRDGSVEPPVDATVVTGDAGTDAGTAGEDAGPVSPQCQPCATDDPCPAGYTCARLGVYEDFCTVLTDATGKCPEHLSPVIYYCSPSIPCGDWLEMYGNQ
jgi:hypothetical protein